MGRNEEKIGRVRKAVVPAAGLGTRFLPACKSIPKEMLCLVDKPLIQYIFEEAYASGVEQFIVVTARGKSSMEDHFDLSYELEDILRRRGKEKALEEVSRLWRMMEVFSVRQHEPLGLGHAIYCARNIVGDEPFLVMLPDDIVDNPSYPCAKQLVDVYEKFSGPVVALMEVPEHMFEKYGMVKFERVEENVVRVFEMIEKPKPSEAPSNLGIVARYLFTPDIFRAIEETKPGWGGEIQITDAIRILADRRPVYGCIFSGRRFDAGDKLGYLEATVHFGLKHPELKERFRDYLEKVMRELF